MKKAKLKSQIGSLLEMLRAAHAANAVVAAERDKYRHDFFSAQAEGARWEALTHETNEEASRLRTLMYEREDEVARTSRLLDEAADRIDQLERSLRAVAAERDDFHTKWADATRNVNKLEDIIELNEQYEDERAGQQDTESIPTVDVSAFAPTWHGLPDPRGKIADEQRESMHDVLDTVMAEHEPVAKSAIEVPRDDAPDEAEGKVIAHMTVAELKPGFRFRFEDGKPFETLRSIVFDQRSESIFDDPDGTVRLQVSWGGSGYFKPDRAVQVECPVA